MQEIVADALADGRGIDIRVLNVRSLTDITDFMVIAAGTSDRHVKTLCDRVLEFMAEANFKPVGVEGEAARDWVLVDYVDVVVHIMREGARKHYDLESLWDESLTGLGTRAAQ